MLQLHWTRAVAALFCIVVLWRFLASIPTHSTTTEHHTGSLKKTVGAERWTNWHQYWLRHGTNKLARLPDASTVRQQLAFQFPYEPKKPYPAYIWQTWKVGLNDPAFPLKYKSFQRLWHDKNPEHMHIVMLDEQCDLLVRSLYEGVPDVLHAWSVLPKSILKADFFRYLVLYARGGVYLDIDTTSLKAVGSWVLANATINNEENTLGIVVGIEADPDRPDWHDWYARRIQFCQWTIQAKKGHPLLGELIAKITALTLQREKKRQLRKVLGKDEGGDIMDWTGPGIWTDAVFEYMNNAAQPEEARAKHTVEEIVTWRMFTGLQAPKVVGDVLVLPITSFSPDVGQMGAHLSGHPLAYAKHMFSGSWKKDG